MEKCEACQRMRTSQCHEKLQPSMANFPKEMVPADIFEFNAHHYLVMADRHSGYPWIHQLSSSTHGCNYPHPTQLVSAVWIPSNNQNRWRTAISPRVSKVLQGKQHPPRALFPTQCSEQQACRDCREKCDILASKMWWLNEEFQRS